MGTKIYETDQIPEQSKTLAGPNWYAIAPGRLMVLSGRLECIVVDLMRDGKFMLDRYFIRNKVHIHYPEKGRYHINPKYPHCALYLIRFRMPDLEKVKAALDMMHRQAPLFENGEEYTAVEQNLHDAVEQRVKQRAGKEYVVIRGTDNGG